MASLAAHPGGVGRLSGRRLAGRAVLEPGSASQPSGRLSPRRGLRGTNFLVVGNSPRGDGRAGSTAPLSPDGRCSISPVRIYPTAATSRGGVRRTTPRAGRRSTPPGTATHGPGSPAVAARPDRPVISRRRHSAEPPRLHGANHLVVGAPPASIGPASRRRRRPRPSGIPRHPSLVQDAPDVTAVGDGFFAVWSNGPNAPPITPTSRAHASRLRSALDPDADAIAIGGPDPTRADPPGTPRDPSPGRDRTSHRTG